MDEPTASLDPKSSGWFIDFLAQKELTTVLSTHNLSLAYELGDRAIVLDNTHSIIYDGDIKELFKNELEEEELEAKKEEKSEEKKKETYKPFPLDKLERIDISQLPLYEHALIWLI